MAEQVEPKLELATVRGIACVALVAYHVVGPTNASGMHLPGASPWHLVMNSLDFLRMPMFSVLSGYLYAARRVDLRSLSQFARRKAVRLLAPLLFVTAVMVALRHSVYGEETSYATALLFHYQHLWFLQALILIFIGISLWDAFARPTWVGLCIVAFVSVMISRTFNISSFLSLGGALYLLPFFAGGMILRTEPKVLCSRNVVILCSSIVAATLLMQQASIMFSGNMLARNSMPAAVCGLSASFLMLVLCPRITTFERIAPYSFAIYLWHSIAASAVRQIALSHLVLPQPIEFLLLMIVAIAIPIGFQLTAERIPLMSILAAGLDPSPWRKRGSFAGSRHPKPIGALLATTCIGIEPDGACENSGMRDADFAKASNVQREVVCRFYVAASAPEGSRAVQPIAGS